MNKNGDFFPVEKIIKSRKKNGQVCCKSNSFYSFENCCAFSQKVFNFQTEYFLKWKNYPDTANTWVAERNLRCPDLVKKFEKVLSDFSLQYFNRTLIELLVNFLQANKKENKQNAPSKRRRLENNQEINADTVSNDDTTQIDNDEAISTNDTNEKVFKCYTVFFVS